MPGAVLGLDLAAALAMAEALGIDARAAAEFLPAIEAMMVRGINAQMAAERG
ncbi:MULTISPECIES: DUF7697 family protein [Sphingomonadales]|uniref:Uncharacterized protein n=1 Tax=Alteraurantiacibacter lauratis TaxID=2054627 RepID=A0ABV7EFH1_9SPHN|nr:hypothetical protein [Sphingopyxis sp. LK2115]